MPHTPPPTARATCARTPSPARDSTPVPADVGFFLSALDCDILQVLAPYCTHRDLGRLLRTCSGLRPAGSCDSGFMWRVWTARAEPLVLCAALRSSIVHRQQGITRCMLHELRESGCDMSSLIAMPRDAGCALFASALHVGDVFGAHKLLALVHADDLFEALLMSIKRVDPITVHYILRDIVDALDFGQCEQLREAARDAVVQGVEFGALYSTVRSVQTQRVVLDALYP